MIRRFWLLMAAAGCLLANGVFALETVQVAVFPFQVYSLEDFSYLKTEIPRQIQKHLKDEGAEILESKGPEAISGEDEAAGISRIRNSALEIGADYAVWGSLTWIGRRFSLDVKLMSPFGEDTVQTFYEEGQGVENLPAGVRNIARDLSLKIFKRARVARVAVSGNKRIEKDAIERRIKIAPGDVYLGKTLAEDLKSVYAMGYFEDVRIEAEDGPDGKTITFLVTEKPTIRSIHFTGNRIFEDEELKENLDIRVGSILNIFSIQKNIQRIQEVYKEKNYHNVTVTYKIEELQNNQSVLEFIIEEGKKVMIRQISFEGNASYDDKKLKKLMKTSEKGYFSWITSSGELNREKLDQDIVNLAAFYHNTGYIQAKIGDPEIRFEQDRIDIGIKIDEGPQFRVGKVDVDGDLILDREILLSKLKISKETYYNLEQVRNDVLALTDLYSDEGYAYAQVKPQIEKDSEKMEVNLTYRIDKEQQVYFEKIFISGNVNTRDKVIRRELKVYEQELYRGKELKRGVRNLYRLDYFEDVKIDTVKGSAEDQMVLKIDVQEKPTGAFTFGGGYSSVEDIFFMASISQRNLFGLGQILQLKAEIGGATSRYTLSFTEPWLFDIPLSAGFDIYNWDRDYDTYERESQGATVRFGYPVWDYTRFYLAYGFEISDISEVTDDASDLVKDMDGTYTTSSVTATLRYDSRDRMFNPTEGSDHRLTVQYAGLGGDVGFIKYVAETGWYFPLFWDMVGFLHGQGGYVEENSGMKLPDYERFYLGGMNSLRGFDWRDVCAFDEEGSKIGGDRFIQFNAEWILPLIKKAGLVGVVFYDTGNVYNDESMDLGNLRQSAGYGIRWYSPMGPIRIENGYILDPKEGEDSGGRWEFSMGSAF